MNLEYFKYVFDVCETKSISQSSERLIIPKIDIIKAITTLEEKYNIVIFKRKNNMIELTNEGRIFTSNIKNIIKKIDNMKNSNLISNKENTLNLQLVSDVNYNIATILVQYYHENKNNNSIKIKVKESIRDVVIEDVINKEYEIGIFTTCNIEKKMYIGLIHKYNLEYEEIATMKGYVIVGSKNPLYYKDSIVIDELDGMPVVHYTGKIGSRFNVYLSKKILKLVESNKKMYFNDKKTMERAIASTDAYILTLDKNQTKNTDLRAIPLNISDITFNLGWIKRKDTNISMEAKLFLRMIYEYYNKIY